MDRHRILIIHENRRVVDKLQSVFVQSGFEAEIALSPSVGLSIVAERRMSAAVLGASIGHDGDWSFVKNLKKYDPNLPVVLFDAPKVKGLSREARRAGVSRLVATPADPEQILTETVKAMGN